MSRAQSTAAVLPAPTFEPDERLYFSLSTFIDLLASACREHAPETFQRAMHFLGDEPAQLTRTIAFVLTVMDETDVRKYFDERHLVSARQTLAGVLEAASLMVELDNSALVDKMLAERAKEGRPI